MSQDVERIYELSPMQQAMLVASLYEPGSGVYVVQVALGLTGRLDLVAFERAWRSVLARHDILRTGFYWEDLEKPVQVVYRDIDLPLRHESWRGMGTAGQEERLQAFLDADRERGFDLGAPPLLRLSLIELDIGIEAGLETGGWQLVWTMHHILADGWSRSLLLQELFASYAAFAAGAEPALAPRRSYEDYIVWLQGWDPAEAESFWRRSLKGFSSPTLLAGSGNGYNGHRGHGAASFRHARQRGRRLPPETTEVLRDLARRQHLTVATLLQGAWALVLASETGSAEVVFGGTVAGRPLDLPGADSMVGLFINTLPVRVAVDPERPLLPWLAALQERQSEAHRYEHAPLTEVQAWSELAPGTALFDNILVVENYPLDGALAERLPDLAISGVRTNELTGYPLHVMAVPGPTLELDLIYDARRLGDAAAARLEDRLARMLEAFTGAAHLRLRDVPLLLPAERQQLVAEWNDTATAFPAGLCVHELVAVQAAWSPESVAVRGGGRELLYGELMACSNRLARRLAGLGVGPETLVGVCAERTPSMLVALLGVLGSGGAYVPLDPTHPRERLAFVLADSGTRVVVTERALLGVLPPHGAQVVLLDGEEEEPAGGELAPAVPENLAYVIYTSGSTGRPKGVEVRHRGVVNYLASMAARPGLAAGDAMLAVTTLSFDIAVTELLLPLTVGARIELVDRETAGDAALLAAALEASGATCMQATPATWTLLVEGGWRGRSGLKALCGGEALPRALAEKLLGRVDELWNLYGPTETTVWSALLRVAAGAGAVPIGLPLGNTALHVLSAQGGLAPLGAVGEVAIGGEGLARGYHGRGDLTAERFVPDPFGGEVGGRLYRTGDLARRLPDGTLEFLGRVDHQVKLRGFRIELGEIESVLAGHPAVRECVVVARHAEHGDKALVAYLVTRDEAPPPPAGELRAFLAAALPPYMVPAAFVTLAALPLSPAGKIDRKALPSPDDLEEGAAEATSFPADPIAELVAGVWAEVLGRASVGLDDDFFALGGHSLLATRVISRLRNVLGVELPLRSLIEKRTVAALAALAVAARAERLGDRPEPPLVPVPREQEPPLSFAQERLWFIDQLEPGSPRYNIAAAVRLAGPLAEGLLARAFTEVVRRHEVLRATFTSRGGRPVQALEPEPRLALPLVDLSGLPGAEAVARELAAAESLAPFDLGTGPLLRLTLLRLADRRHLLLATLHHIVADGWSLIVLVREVQALYRAWIRGERSPLPELPVQYADFAVWQRRWMAGEGLERQLAYWRERLEGGVSAGGLDLPTDRPRPAMLSQRGGEHRFMLGGELSGRLTALGRSEGVTSFMIVSAALCALLSRLSGEPALNIAAPIAARNRLEIEGLIGCFVNTLVLRSEVGRAETFLELLEQTRETTLGAYAHQDLPFERLVDELRPERDLSRSPLAQVALSFHNMGLPEADLDGLRMTSEDPPSQVAKFDLAFILAEDREGGFSGWLQYAADLYDAATAVRLAQHFTRCLDELTAWPDQPLAEVAYLTVEERQQVLLEWNDTAAGPASPALLHQLFEARAGEQPGAPAVAWNGIEVTYAELEARANRLAHLLARLAAPRSPRGLPVGVWMERSHHMPAALLGILKAGGTYIPIDPAWPAERAEAVLAATGAAIAAVSRSTLAMAEALRWRLPRLNDLVCLDVETPEVEAETVDEDGIRALWDLVAARATDRVTAGGFVDSFTGRAFGDVEVDEYRDRVLALAAPWLRPEARVLEVGSGAGLILWEMARRTARCVGLDPSAAAQERGREHARAAGIGNVDLVVGFAHEIGDRFAAGSFDLVVLASTVQFFSGPRYLEKVVAQALRLLAPGGALLLADVMDARREAELEEALAAAGAPPKRGARELWLDEDLFRDLAVLPGVERIEILHRTEGFDNELGFRYDVIFHGGTAESSQRSKRLWTGWHVEQCSAARPPASGSTSDIAYVIHTSGSTGVPKGIAVQHAPAVALIGWINTTFGVGPEDRLLFITSLAFDLSVYDVFGALAAGATVEVAPEAALGDAQRLVGLLGEKAITIWDSAPAALQQLAPLFPEKASGHPLRLVLLSGDWIPVRLPDQVRAAFPAAQVVALGGATEATVWSNWYPVGEVDPRWPSIPYGRPIPGARYHVLDAAMQPQPISVPGDLYIGGSCLCVGYAGQPELTAAQFVPDPFAPSAEPGARLYRTGDRAQAFRDGNLEFLGRVDQRLKVRGYRIEPGEIEIALLRHPAVREAVVILREDRPGDQLLVAYVVPRAAAPEAQELRGWLHGKLPSYMVPGAFVILDSLPVTANGKLDRGRLPDPRGDHAEPESYAAPSDEVEVLLAGLFAEILGRERVGVRDSFFTLGGHSLLATQLISRVRGTLGVELPLPELFAGPTVAELARAVRSRRVETALAPPVVPVPRPAGGEMPLSFAQQRLWFIDQLEPGSAAYNVPWAARLDGEIDAGRLRRTLEEVVRRHEALRTTFSPSSRGPVARARPAGPGRRGEPWRWPLPVVDLEGLPKGAAEAEILLLAAAEALRPFSLTRGPLLRSTLLRLGEREHVLVAVAHHIVADGWSVGILLQEVGAVYRAFTRGEGSPLPELPIQYADFAVWQREWLQGEVLDEQLAHWRDRLAGAPLRLELPADRPRPDLAGHRSGLLPLALDAGRARDLAALSRGAGATLFMTLLAAYSVLLGRWANQEDVVVGTPIANRNRQEIEGLIGFFVNTLPLRIHLGEAPTFRALLGRVRQVALDAYSHQDLPFERLVEEVVAERDLAHSPLVQAMLTLQNAPVVPLEVPGVAVSPLVLEAGEAKLDLILTLFETPAGLSGVLEYDAGLFDRTTAERLLGRFQGLLDGALAEPDRAIWDLPFLLAGESRQLLAEWNDTASDYPREASVPVLFEEWVRAAPQAPAVVAEGKTWSYGRLDEAANRLAGYLRALGVERRESPVGVAMERSPDFIVALLAVLKAGGVYVPLDPGYPDERLAFMLADTGARLVVVHGQTRERFAGHAATVVCVERDREAIARHAGMPPSHPVSADELAYIIYTSGSTGQPKGVAVTHRAIARLVRGTNYAQLGPDDRVGHVSNISFDAATFEIWGALANGGAVVVIEREVVLSPGRLAVALAEEGVTAMFLTSALFSQVVREEPAAFYPLRHLLVGGDALDPVAVGRALSEGAPERLLNGYGPTESTTFAVWSEVMEVAPGTRSIPIGRPLANTAAYAVDPRGGLAALGQVGELYLGGDGLARGYLNRPELTAEKLVPDPWSGQPGARLYRTGDLVRRRWDGVIDFLGRFDHQVKIRGFRVEPDEVEAVLAGAAGVRECAVLARRDIPGEVRLVAYVVAAPGAGVGEDTIRDYLKRSLPEYMLPSALVFLDSLPLTPNGKLDRTALPAPEGVARRTDAYVAPRSPIEGLLVTIWEEVLGREGVGVEDDFFAVGGHSLLATQVSSRVREAFGVELPLNQMFERPTIAGLAAELSELLRGAAFDEAPPILAVPRPEGGEMPLSFAQQRLWFIEQLEPGNPAYNIPWVARVTGDLAVGRLQRSLEEVVRRHEALRTTFSVSVQGGARGPVQRVQESWAVPLPVASLEGLPEAAKAAEVQRLVLEHHRAPFDFVRGPLLRSFLLRLGPREHVLQLTIHHVVSDGWSTRVLFQEVGILYGAFGRGESSPLPELPVQYADFAVWQRGWLQGEVLERHLSYWRDRLAGAPPRLELPTDRPRPVVASSRGGRIVVLLPPEIGEAAAPLGRREGATLFMVALAAWSAFLYRLTGVTDLVVGTPTANRNRRETEGLIGFFINNLALRTDLSGAPTFRDLLGRVREGTVGAHVHQDLPFERLVEELAPERSLSYTPLFQVMAALQNVLEPFTLPGLSLTPIVFEATTAKLDLTLEVVEFGSGLEAILEFSRDLFDTSTAVRLLGQLTRLLAAAVADPALPVDDLPLLAAGEEHQLLFEWNDTRSAEPHAERPVDAWISEIAAELPGAPALMHGEIEISYGEMERRATRLARRLVALGVGPERVVGICLEPAPALVIAMLAVWKAGGAYLPLDPAYPAERLGFLLADAGAHVLLGRSDLLARLPPYAAPWLAVDDGGDTEDGKEEELPERGAAVLDHLAYVIHTSGSTGTPKGVAVTHRGLGNLAASERRMFGLGPGDRVLLFASFSFDASVYDVLAALASGAAVVLAGPEERLPGPDLVRLLQRQRVSWVLLTPSALAALPQAELPDLRILTVGSEPCPAELVARWAPGRRFFNLYGPTEMTVVTAAGECVPAAAPPPIGRPIVNTQGYLLDARLRPVPPGVDGELYLAGPGLARGYLGRPDLTAERFVPDPWGEPGGRLYRTGDRVRARPDGRIDYLGRLDQQVKVRGFRIEPGEIEAALASCLGVREAAVAVREERPGDRRLTAYVVGVPELSARGLREALGRLLPDHMMPSAFAFVPSFPLTPSRKLDRRALALIAPERQEEGYLAPRTPVEEVLAAIWAEVLEIDKVGAADDFFALSGHSLLATQVVSRVREALGVELPLRRLFEHATLAELALEAEALWSADGTGRAAPISPAPRDRPLPASFYQDFAWRIDGGGGSTNSIPFALRMRGPLDIAALSRSLDETVRRHESLRTTFREDAGEVYLEIAPPSALPLPVVDLEALPEERGTRLVQQLAEAHAAHPFALARGPLFVAELLRLGPEAHVLLLNVHHCVADGWSYRVLLNELAALYSAFSCGEPSPLPEPAVQFADFAWWQRHAFADHDLGAQLDWWRRLLADRPGPPELPVDRQRPAILGPRVVTAERRLPEATAQALRALARTTGGSLSMALYAGILALLHRYSGQQDLIVDSIFAARNRPETAGLIGLLMNTVPVRTDLSQRPSFRELLRRVRDSVLAAYEHQDVPFPRLLAELFPGQKLSRTLLSGVTFNMLSFPEAPSSASGLALEVFSAVEEVAKQDLNVVCSEAANGVLCYLRGAADLFLPAGVAAMARDYEELLTQAAIDPDAPIDGLLPTPHHRAAAGTSSTIPA